MSEVVVAVVVNVDTTDDAAAVGGVGVVVCRGDKVVAKYEETLKELLQSI